MIFAHFSPLPGHFPQAQRGPAAPAAPAARPQAPPPWLPERLQGHLQLAVQVLDGATGGQKSTYFSWETLGI